MQSADCSGKFDAQFDENGKLFSVTFHEQLARGTAEEHFEAASKRFTETFGAPAVQDDNGTGTQYLEWQDKSSGTKITSRSAFGSTPISARSLRWHMGGFDDAAKGGSFAISLAFDRYPLAVKLHMADLESTYLREKGTSDVR